LATLRHAIISQIRNPPKGFEEAVINHYKLISPKLLHQVKNWLEEASPPFKEKFAKALVDLKNELKKL